MKASSTLPEARAGKAHQLGRQDSPGGITPPNLMRNLFKEQVFWYVGVCRGALFWETTISLMEVCVSWGVYSIFSILGLGHVMLGED